MSPAGPNHRRDVAMAKQREHLADYRRSAQYGMDPAREAAIIARWRARAVVPVDNAGRFRDSGVYKSRKTGSLGTRRQTGISRAAYSKLLACSKEIEHSRARLRQVDVGGPVAKAMHSDPEKVVLGAGERHLGETVVQENPTDLMARVMR